jgi:hypothetical protein
MSDNNRFEGDESKVAPLQEQVRHWPHAVTAFGSR